MLQASKPWPVTPKACGVDSSITDHRSRGGCPTKAWTTESGRYQADHWPFAAMFGSGEAKEGMETKKTRKGSDEEKGIEPSAPVPGDTLMRSAHYDTSTNTDKMALMPAPAHAAS